MNINTFNKIKDDLRIGAKQYFEIVYQKAREQANSVSELQIILKMHSELGILKKNWEPIFEKKAIRFEMNSYFIHRYPTVQYKGEKKGVEFGDILYIHRNYSENPATAALLLQAKVTKNPTISERQFKLYHGWPIFKFLTPKRMIEEIQGSNQFDIFPKSPHKGARYLFINNENHDICGICRYKTAAPLKGLSKNTSDTNLIEELLEVIALSAGRLLGNDDWGRAIKAITKWAPRSKYKEETREKSIFHYTTEPVSKNHEESRDNEEFKMGMLVIEINTYDRGFLLSELFKSKA